MLPRFVNGLGPAKSSSALPKAMAVIFTFAALYHLQLLSQLPHDIEARFSPTSDVLAAESYNKTFLSYGPQNCFPSFNATLYESAVARNRSCARFAPFHLTETHRTAFATASSGGALSLAYERTMQSQMTHSIIHDTSVHMLCTELRSGMWNKIAFLHNLVSTELLKPASERLDWILWADRDTLIMDQCRPLSSFLPPKTPEFNTVDLIINHDFNGLNAGVFFFRPSHWVLDFFTVVLGYPYYRPSDQLVFAEQSAMARIIASSPAISAHTARVPGYWFNAYPPNDGNTAGIAVANNSSAPNPGPGPGPGREWFRARPGDFLVHFAGHPWKEKELLAWADVLDQAGDVWADKQGRRDVSVEIAGYWKAWKEGVVTEGMRNGYLR